MGCRTISGIWHVVRRGDTYRLGYGGPGACGAGGLREFPMNDEEQNRLCSRGDSLVHTHTHTHTHLCTPPTCIPAHTHLHKHTTRIHMCTYAYTALRGKFTNKCKCKAAEHQIKGEIPLPRETTERNRGWKESGQEDPREQD